MGVGEFNAYTKWLTKLIKSIKHIFDLMLFDITQNSNKQSSDILGSKVQG